MMLVFAIQLFAWAIGYRRLYDWANATQHGFERDPAAGRIDDLRIRAENAEAAWRFHRTRVDRLIWEIDVVHVKEHVRGPHMLTRDCPHDLCRMATKARTGSPL
jgi:hypothetical protein